MRQAPENVIAGLGNLFRSGRRSNHRYFHHLGNLAADDAVGCHHRTDDGMNLIPRDQLPKCIAGFSSIGLVVFDNQLDLLAEDAAFGIDFFYSHNHSINYRQTIGCHWTGGRAYNSNLEGFRRPLPPVSRSLPLPLQG